MKLKLAATALLALFCTGCVTHSSLVTLKQYREKGLLIDISRRANGGLMATAIYLAGTPHEQGLEKKIDHYARVAGCMNGARPVRDGKITIDGNKAGVFALFYKCK